MVGTVRRRRGSFQRKETGGSSRILGNADDLGANEESDTTARVRKGDLKGRITEGMNGAQESKKEQLQKKNKFS